MLSTMMTIEAALKNHNLDFTAHRTRSDTPNFSSSTSSPSAQYFFCMAGQTLARGLRESKATNESQSVQTCTFTFITFIYNVYRFLLGKSDAIFAPVCFSFAIELTTKRSRVFTVVNVMHHFSVGIVNLATISIHCNTHLSFLFIAIRTRLVVALMTIRKAMLVHCREVLMRYLSLRHFMLTQSPNANTVSKS